MEVLVDRLKLGNLYVGYRVNLVTAKGDPLAFDMEDSLLKPFLRLLCTNNVKKGCVISGKEVDGRFVTDNEKNVYEVETISMGAELLDRYYFGNIESIDDILITEQESDEENDNQAKENEAAEESRNGLDGLTNANFGDVPVAYEFINKAADGVACTIQCIEHPGAVISHIVIQCMFDDFREYLSFTYNLMSLLNRKLWTPVFTVKDPFTFQTVSEICGRVMIPKSKNEFIADIIKHLKLGNFHTTANRVDISGKDNACTFKTVARDVFVASYSIPTPGCCESNIDPKSFKAPFFRVQREKKLKEKNTKRKLEVDR